MIFPKGNVYGKLPITPLELIQSLDSRKFGKHELRFPNSKRYYPDTEDLFEYLNAVGEARHVDGKKVTAKGIKCFHLDKNAKRRATGKHNKAFLLDYLWWKNGQGTLLAAESELSLYDEKSVRHDFEKILCWKAPLKLMIVREPPDKRQTKGNKTKNDEKSHENFTGWGDSLTKYVREEMAFPQFVKNECVLLFVFGKKENSAYAWVGQKDRDRNFYLEKIL